MPLPLQPVDPKAAEQYVQPLKPGARVLGRSGMPVIGGRADYEPNRKITPDSWWRRQVPRIEVCPPVDTATGVQVDFLCTGKYTVPDVPGGDPEASEYLRQQWSLEGRPVRSWVHTTTDGRRIPRVSDPWETNLRAMAPSLYAGAACFEYDTYFDEQTGRVFLGRLHRRAMRSIGGYVVDPETEELVAVDQWVSSGVGIEVRRIPRSQLFLLSFRKRGSNDHDGFGLWRAIAADAEDLLHMANYMRISAERFAVPGIDIPIDIQVAEAQNALPPDQDRQAWYDEEVERAKRWGERYRAGLESVLARPPWWGKPEVFGLQGYDPEKLIKSSTHLIEKIFWQLTADALIVGGTQAGGSYSAAEVKTQRTGIAMHNAGQWLCGELDSQVNRQLLALNFPKLPPELYPTIKVELRAPVFVQMLSQVVQLCNLGYPITRRQMDAINRALELPAYDPNDERVTFGIAGANAPQNGASAPDQGTP